MGKEKLKPLGEKSLFLSPGNQGGWSFASFFKSNKSNFELSPNRKSWMEARIMYKILNFSPQSKFKKMKVG